MKSINRFHKYIAEYIFTEGNIISALELESLF